MALQRFDLKNAGSFAEAAELLRTKKAAAISGGTDLLHGFKDNIYKEYPDLIINLRTIPGASGIDVSESGVTIGSLTTVHELESSAVLQKSHRALAEAAYVVATPQIRNNATIGGNICQEPRCWYYRNADGLFDCLRKGGTFCNAQTGHNEIHSIFGSMRVKDTPCQEECPAGNAIPSYFSRLRDGDYAAAAKILIRTNPLAAVTGRVCPHTCTGGCNRGQVDEPVDIRSIERSVGDYMLEHWAELTGNKKAPAGRRAAIVGSGPAGLAAAFFLAMEGWTPVVFDQMEKAGGMLRYGIPAYRLPDSVLDLQIRRLEETGVEFRCGVSIGKDKTIAELKEEYDGVFLGTGAWSPVSIGLDGEELTSPAMEMLRDIALGKKVPVGETVIVIGGGNVAVDAAMSAKRLGAKNVTMVCLESREEMPAFDDDIRAALHEGVGIDTCWGPDKVLAEDGKVTGIRLIRCTSVRDENGRFAPAYDPSVSKTLSADQIVLAVGQKTDLSYLEGPLSSGRVIPVSDDTQQTAEDGLYAGGDAVTGPASVVKAMAAGRRAAQTMSGSASAEECAKCRSLSCFSSACLTASCSSHMDELPDEERDLFKEDALGFRPEQVLSEAERCFNCGCVAASPSDIAPALMALGARIRTTKREIPADEFFSVAVRSSTVLDDDELVTAVLLPPADGSGRSAYMKFRQRKSIDFPLVSVAAAVSFEGEKISAARIVLGAVAPVPLHAEKAEAYLAGKELNEETAAEAAALALEDALPLARNQYKIQVARAYVRRALLRCQNI